MRAERLANAILIATAHGYKDETDRCDEGIL
jgi:hypothetical protein